MNIVLIGPQGSGKGTQAELIEQKYSYKHISTGDLYREAVRKKDQEVLKVREKVDKGGFMPDKMVLRLIEENLAEHNILDGFPRTLEQAEALDEITEVNLVIDLFIPDEVSVRRLSTRRQCTDCRAVFGEENPPRKPGICNRCGGKLYQREDDKPEYIRKRLEKYHDETEPLLEYYKPRKIVHKIRGDRKIEEVFKEICEVIENSVL